MLSRAYIVAAVPALGLLHFLCTPLHSGGLTLLIAPVWGVVSVLFWRFMDSADSPASTRVLYLTALLAVLLGELLKTPAAGAGVLIWSVPAAALAALSAFLAGRLWRRGGAAFCFLCRGPLSSGGRMICPRCGQGVCARAGCWEGRHLRCTLCHQREVVLFPAGDEWWTRQLGRRLGAGQCDSCYKEHHEADLRECGRCHWPLCKRCWDYHNGCCPRCRWMIPELPSLLRPLLSPPRPSRAGGVLKKQPAGSGP